MNKRLIIKHLQRQIRKMDTVRRKGNKRNLSFVEIMRPSQMLYNYLMCWLGDIIIKTGGEYAK